MKNLIGANFKMNKTHSELKQYLELFKEKYISNSSMDLIIAPSISGLPLAFDMLEGLEIKLGAQNMHFEESGAYTGEISPNMLKELNCEYVILGHSERREYFAESDELINKKIRSAIKNGIRPILCIGENLEQKKRGLTKENLKMQLINGLWGLKNFNNIDIAYEPIWAIGTGHTAGSEYIEEVHSFIREFLGNDESRIIYGGSVNSKISKEIISLDNVNGFLVGTASLDSVEFLKIVNS